MDQGKRNATLGLPAKVYFSIAEIIFDSIGRAALPDREKAPAHRSLSPSALRTPPQRRRAGASRAL